MLCIRAAYAVMRCLSVCLSVCVCVCVSVTFVSCVKMNKHIIKLFSPSGRHAILVFSVPNGIAIFRRKPPPPNGGVECRWGRHKSRFWAYIWLDACVNAASLQQAGVVNAVADGRPACRKLWHIAGSKRRCRLREKTTKCLWHEASTLRQRQQYSAFNCTQWQICSIRN